jgi:hypothetical protein
MAQHCVFQSDISIRRNEVASIELARPITTLNVLGASNSKQITHISFIDKTARSVTSRIELSYSYNMHARGPGVLDLKNLLNEQIPTCHGCPKGSIAQTDNTSRNLLG